MLDSTSILVGLLGGVAIAGFVGWILSRWLSMRTSPVLSGNEQVQAQQFAAVAQQALAQNSATFLQMARTELEGQFGREREALSGAVTPLRDSLVQVQGLVRSIEEDRNKAYGSLDSNLKNLMTATASLQSETTTLSTALRNPRSYGRWGEVALKRLVELAGMTEHCDFETQVSLSNIEEKFRPDLLIHLPSGRVVPVDSKVSISAYLDATEAKTQAEAEVSWGKHADQIRSHLRQLASKEYAERLQGIGASPEFVVMFIPGDDFLAAALEVDHDLFEEGASKHVMMASPSTLLPLLRVVEAGWKQERFMRSVEQLREEARVLYDRLAGLTDHLGTLGKRLEGAVSEYNAFVGSYEGRVVPQARKLEAMGAQGSKALADVEQIDARPRQPKSSDR